jgi:ATP-binding cassette subfamily B protein
MVAGFIKRLSIGYLRNKCFITREGVSFLGLSEAADSIGFRTMGVRITYEMLRTMCLPCIVHWNQKHFMWFMELTKKKSQLPILHQA